MKNQMLIFKNVVFELFDSQFKISFHCITSKLMIYSNFIRHFIFYFTWHRICHFISEITSAISFLTRLIHSFMNLHFDFFVLCLDHDLDHDFVFVFVSVSAPLLVHLDQLFCLGWKSIVFQTRYFP